MTSEEVLAFDPPTCSHHGRLLASTQPKDRLSPPNRQDPRLDKLASPAWTRLKNRVDMVLASKAGSIRCPGFSMFHTKARPLSLSLSALAQRMSLSILRIKSINQPIKHSCRGRGRVCVFLRIGWLVVCSTVGPSEGVTVSHWIFHENSICTNFHLQHISNP